MVKVMTFNIRYGDYDRNLTNIGNYCRGQDIVCLQEVDQNTNRWFPGGSGDQLATLRPYVGHGVYFRGKRYPGWGGLGRGWMGQAILSRWPIVKSQSFAGGNADWSLSYARIDHPVDGPLHVFSEHYPLRPESLKMRHSAALVTAIKTVTREGGRVIVGGDFNHDFGPDHLGGDPVGHLARTSGLQWAFAPGRDTWPEGPHHIDHILTRGFRSDRLQCATSAYSDHPAVRAELEAVAVPPSRPRCPRFRPHAGRSRPRSRRSLQASAGSRTSCSVPRPARNHACSRRSGKLRPRGPSAGSSWSSASDRTEAPCQLDVRFLFEAATEDPQSQRLSAFSLSSLLRTSKWPAQLAAHPDLDCA